MGLEPPTAHDGGGTCVVIEPPKRRVRFSSSVSRSTINSNSDRRNRRYDAPGDGESSTQPSTVPGEEEDEEKLSYKVHDEEESVSHLEGFVVFCNSNSSDEPSVLYEKTGLDACVDSSLMATADAVEWIFSPWKELAQYTSAIEWSNLGDRCCTHTTETFAKVDNFIPDVETVREYMPEFSSTKDYIPDVVDVGGKAKDYLSDAWQYKEVKQHVVFDDNGEWGVYTGMLCKTTEKPHGRGKATYQSGRWYDGEWEQGVVTGHGSLKDKEGDLYEGEFQNNEKHGSGTMTFADGHVFFGEYSHNEMVKGKIIYKDGSSFEGAWVDGMKHGKGKLHIRDCSVYYGDFKAGAMHGKGTFKKEDGALYEGEFKNGLFHGIGKYTWPDGSTYRGAWWEGERGEQEVLPNGTQLLVQREEKVATPEADGMIQEEKGEKGELAERNVAKKDILPSISQLLVRKEEKEATPLPETDGIVLEEEGTIYTWPDDEGSRFLVGCCTNLPGSCLPGSDERTWPDDERSSKLGPGRSFPSLLV